MVTARIVKKSNKYVSFCCEGHAGYADAGEDIVCSAISILTINTANSITELTNSMIDIEYVEGYISWKFHDFIDEKAILLMDSMLLGLKTIEDTYNKKYLTLIIEEV